MLSFVKVFGKKRPKVEKRQSKAMFCAKRNGYTLHDNTLFFKRKIKNRKSTHCAHFTHCPASRALSGLSAKYAG
jgi:hypothetical protein